MRRGLHRWIGSGSTFGHRLCACLAYGRSMITNAHLLHLLHPGHKKAKLPGSRCLTVSRLLFLATLLAIPSLCIILCAPTTPATAGFSYDKTGCTPLENRIRPYVTALPGVPSGTCHTLHEAYSAIARFCNHRTLLYDHHILHHRTHPNKPLPTCLGHPQPSYALHTRNQSILVPAPLVLQTLPTQEAHDPPEAEGNLCACSPSNAGRHR